MKNRGFTLIEMLVSLGIFAVLLVAVMSAFVSGFAYQKRIVEMQAVQREGSYLMEMLSREIRMATAINATQSGNKDSSIVFTNHEGNLTEYCQSSQDVAYTKACNNSGEYFAVINRDTAVADIVNSSDIRLTSLKFYTSNQDFSVSQPLITIVMNLQSKKDTSVTLSLQSTVAMRLYK
ncbi:MAG: type II secretion system protein [Candidatus Paceibacterota bacterium]